MNVLVTGARGVVGPSLLRCCAAAGLVATGAGRSEQGGSWVCWDMAGFDPPFGHGFEAMLHAAPLWLLSEQIEGLADRGVSTLAALSSTSVVTKQESSSDRERATAEALARAECWVLEASGRVGMSATLLRPTLIYGYGRDANVSAVARFIKRYGFFPVAGAASGRRQPVHADDVAGAMVAAIECPAAAGKTYCLTGGETLSYRDMVGRIFDGLGRPRRILALPETAYRALLSLAAAVNRNVSGAMAGRMNADLVFDAAEARRDLAFRPQRFLERPERDLVYA